MYFRCSDGMNRKIDSMNIPKIFHLHNINLKA